MATKHRSVKDHLEGKHLLPQHDNCSFKSIYTRGTKSSRNEEKKKSSPPKLSKLFNIKFIDRSRLIHFIVCVRIKPFGIIKFESEVEFPNNIVRSFSIWEMKRKKESFRIESNLNISKWEETLPCGSSNFNEFELFRFELVL